MSLFCFWSSVYFVYFLLLLLFFVIFCPSAAVTHTFPSLWDNKGSGSEFWFWFWLQWSDVMFCLFWSHWLITSTSLTITDQKSCWVHVSWKNQSPVLRAVTLILQQQQQPRVQTVQRPEHHLLGQLLITSNSAWVNLNSSSSRDRLPCHQEPGRNPRLSCSPNITAVARSCRFVLYNIWPRESAALLYMM